MPCRSKLLIFLLIFHLFLTVAFAQTKEGRLIISVKDQLDNVISDAEVTLFKIDKKEKQTKTNNQGEAHFTKLANDSYQIIIVSKGFLEYKSQPFELKRNEVKRIEIVLEVAPVQSKVEVDSSDSVQADDYGMVTVLTEEDIQKLPDDPEEFLKALRRLVGESITGEELPINVNGINGERIPPKQMIQQIRVDRNVFSAKYGGTGGGGIDIITSSGAIKFKGYANFGFSDSRLNAGDPFIGRKAPSQSRNYSLGFSGPLGKKSSYSIELNRMESDSSTIINAVILDSQLRLSEFKSTFPTPNRNNGISLRLNTDPSKKHKIYLSYGYSFNRMKGVGVGYFSLPERAGIADNRNQYLSLSHTYVGSEKFFSRTIFSGNKSKSKTFSDNNSPAINVSESFSGGGAQLDNLNSSLNFRLANDSTLQIRKSSSIEYGFSLRREQRNLVSRSNFGGTYTFAGKTAPLLDSFENPILDSEGKIVVGQISSLESYRRTLLFRRLGYSAARIRELGGGADQFTISGGNPNISAAQIELSLYLQGSYNIRKNLSLNLGIRYENQTNFKSSLNFSPTFSMIWTPKVDKKKSVLYSLPRISLGTRISFSQFGLNNIISLKQTSEDGRLSYFISKPEILDTFPNVPSVDLLEQLSISKTRRFLDPQIKSPFQAVSNISFNKKLTEKISINISLSHSRSFRSMVTRNINAPLAGTFDPLNPARAIYPFGNQGNIYQLSSLGKGSTNNVFVSLKFPSWENVWGKPNLNISYNFNKSRSNSYSGSGSPFDPYDFSREFSPTTNDGVHTINGFLGFRLPYKFSIQNNWSIRSGSRFNIYTGRDTNGDGDYSERPAFATDINKPGVVITKYGALDPNPSPTDKIIPRNLGRGPKNIGFNTSIYKVFGFNEDKINKKPPKQSLSFSVNINNTFNINNKANPIGNMSSPRFSRSISGAPDTDGFSGGNLPIELLGSSIGFIGIGSNPRSTFFSTTFQF